MRRLLPFFLWIWGGVVFAFILGAAINWVFGPPREEVVLFLHAYWRVILSAFLVLGGVTLAPGVWYGKGGRPGAAKAGRGGAGGL
jgi:hypothetical protein